MVDTDDTQRIFEIIKDLKMLNTHLRLKLKIFIFQKLLHSQGIILSFKANLTLKVKVKVTSFQTHLRYLDDQ